MTDESLARDGVHNPSRWGYLYVLTNESMPGLVKIGYTTRDPRGRALELFKQSTGVPTPFHVAFAIFCSEPARAELDVFEELRRCRVSGNREFFRVDVDRAIEHVASVGLSYCSGDCLSVSPSDFIVDEGTTGSLRLDIEQLLGVELSPPAGASILSMVTAEEALPAARRYIARLEKSRDLQARLGDEAGEGEQ